MTALVKSRGMQNKENGIRQRRASVFITLDHCYCGSFLKGNRHETLYFGETEWTGTVPKREFFVQTLNPVWNNLI